MIDDPAPRVSIDRCPRCGEVVGDLDRFCPGCGAERGTICPRCGAAAAAQASYCVECGSPLRTPRSGSLPSDPPPLPRTGGSAGRGVRLLIGATLCLLLIVGAVAWIYLSAPERQQERQISQVSTRAPATLSIQSGHPPLLLIGSPSGVLVSEDQGSTWQQLVLNGGVAAIGVSLADSSPVYLAGGRFWRGDGRGFAEIESDLPASAIRALAVDPTDSRRIYAATADRGLVRSDDGGRRWQVVGSNLPPRLTSLVLAGLNHPVFFAATGDHGIFVSADGRSWSNANGFVNGALPTETVYALAFDPHSGDRYVGPTGQVQNGALYAATNLGLFKSIDSGQSWSALPLRRAVGGIAVSANGDRLMVAIDLNGGIFRSRDGGVSWR